MLLNIENLEVFFGNSIAVKKISFGIEAGETFALVGESGSGKSVTALSCVQLLSNKNIKTNGHIWLNGIDILKAEKEDLYAIRGAEIGFVFQEPMSSLNPMHTCGYQVAEAIIRHKKCSKDAARLQTIDLFNEVLLPRAEAIYDAYPHQLSGGQRQRVMIALALSCNPKLLIADEPTTALDVTVQKSIINTLQQIQKNRSMSILFISHDLALVGSIAQNIGVMYKGELVEKGSTEDILQHAKHPYTKGLLACRPQPQLNLKRLPTINSFLNDNNTDIDSVFKALTIDEADNVARIKEINTAKPIIKVENLKVEYSLRKGMWGQKSIVNAVDDVSFVLREGETLGLVGESGSGKSTIGRAIMRLAPIKSGRIFYNNTDITELKGNALQELRKEIQLIFQDPYSSLNPRLSILQALTEPMQVHGLYDSASERKLQAAQLLIKVGLTEEQLNRFPYQFSGGQRQRITIARALAVQPKVIICDESVSALDVSVQAQVLNLLAELREELALSYLFISHDMAVIKHISDTIMVLQNGKIVEQQEADTLFAHPQNSYTQNLLNAVPSL